MDISAKNTGDMSADATILTVEITDLARGGAGLARISQPDGNQKVVFVPFTAPGDRVQIRIVRSHKRYSDGELISIEKESPIRVKPPCPVFGQCGGCEWQHLPYREQWCVKKQGVLAALARVGVIFKGTVEEFPAEQEYGYRNRIQLKGEQDQIGYYRRGTRELVAIEHCPISAEIINSKIPNVREQGRALQAPYKVELETYQGEVRIHWNQRAAAGGFRQVNDQQNEQLRQWIHKVFAPQAGARLLDLYGGSGNLSQLLWEKMGFTDCVDLFRGTPPEPEKVRFHRSEVARWLARAKAPADLALLDPPREGFGDDRVAIVEALARLGVREIIAVGCDPDAWAKDLKKMQERGWELQKVAAFDFFPQTHHVEAAAHLKGV